MPRVSFTQNLQRHVVCAPREVTGLTVLACLEEVFAQSPRLRGYVLDEHGGLRFHMAIYVDGVPIADRRGLSDPVGADAGIFVMQALSGG
jgi:hypothetical protein